MDREAVSSTAHRFSLPTEKTLGAVNRPPLTEEAKHACSAAYPASYRHSRDSAMVAPEDDHHR